MKKTKGKVIKTITTMFSRNKLADEYLDTDLFSADVETANKIQRDYIDSLSQEDPEEFTSPVTIISRQLSSSKESKKLAALYNLSKIVISNNKYSKDANNMIKSYIKENELNLEETRLLVEFFGSEFLK